MSAMYEGICGPNRLVPVFPCYACGRETNGAVVDAFGTRSKWCWICHDEAKVKP